MKLIVAFIRPEQLSPVKQALYAKNYFSMSVTNILGSGRQKGFTETYRGVVMEMNLLKKVRLEVAVPEAKADEVVDTVRSAARTGNEGDGMIFVMDIGRAVRVRTGEEGL